MTQAPAVVGALDRQLISYALTQLSPGHRAVIWRAHYLGWTTGRIARDLGITEALVKRMLHDAVQALRLSLQAVRGAASIPSELR
jgi:RNA polymerase sigma-70 factor (ECF subfamily)